MAEARRVQGNAYRTGDELAAWARLVSEPALEPDLPIIDPHHHLWHNAHHGRYLLPDLLDDIQAGGHDIRATVFIEAKAMYRATGDVALRPLGEVEFVNGVAAMAASGFYGKTQACAGIIGFADLTLGDAVGPILDEMTALSGGRFKGVRHYVRWDTDRMMATRDGTPPVDFMDDERFRRGVAQLARRGLVFEAWQFHPIVDRVAKLARAVPEATIILNHVGGPLGLAPYHQTPDENYRAWRDNLASLVACPNVFVKLGGLGMVYCGFDFHTKDTPPDSETLAAAWRRYLEPAIDLFGPARCLFESNYPVDKQSCGYGVLWNAFKRITAGFSAADKAALYHDNAARLYRLDL